MKTETFKVGDEVRLVSWKTAIERSEKQGNFRYRYNYICKSIYGIPESFYEDERGKGTMIVKSMGKNVLLKKSVYNWPPFCLKKVNETK